MMKEAHIERNLGLVGSFTPLQAFVDLLKAFGVTVKHLITCRYGAF